ncbi:MAG TPA: LuxR C-terminal-related transcriptional regulator [Acidimicrobiia bacterium]|nr:LuxR C-terminal-related transcriptional regulator [Acidimicrobiia bacterium]
MTFLLTDVEASTQAWQSDSAAAAAAIARQEQILAGAITVHNGFRPVEQGEGDSVVAAFARASDAVAAAVEAQLELAREPWPTESPLRVRIALHTGEAEARDGRYAGSTIIRTARLRAAAHGGQTVLSRATAELVNEALPEGAALVDLGTHRLRDLSRAEHVFQVTHPELPSAFPPLRSLDRVANNLPAQLTSFVGREAELAQVERLLAQVRLLTLTGAGGCGKTRLAAHAAAAVVESYPWGVWWVELGPVESGSGVSTAVLSALGLREHPSRTAVDQLADQFGQDRALLVVDNCEHLLDAVVTLVEPLLGRCPELTVLATSREPLGVSGETTWRVPPLTVPATSDPSTPEALTAYDAVVLFVERARQARPNFAVTNENAPAVAEICARLDGIPLAIELAAARVRVLSAEGIRAGLNDRFRLLTGGSKRELGRHQTLAASVEWSHDLLGESERVLFRRLAVFAGGFTLDAAESVCSGDGIEPLDVLDRLTSLVDKSLVVADEDRSQTRYRMLETIRQFALDRLEASGESEAIHERHLAVQLRLAAEADARFLSDDHFTLGQEAEHDNLRGALKWALMRSDVDAATQLLIGLANFWLSRGLLRQALMWFDRVLDHPDAPASPLRYRASCIRGVIALIEGEPHPSLMTAAEGAEQARAMGDRRYVARGLMVHGTVQAMADPPVGDKLLEEAITAADDAEDPFASAFARMLFIVSSLHQDNHARLAGQVEDWAPVFDSASSQMRAMYHALAGWSAVRIGRFDDARRHGETGSALAHEIGDPAMAGALVALMLSMFAVTQWRIDDAAEVLASVLREPRASGPTRQDPMLTGAWGCVLAARGQWDEAERVLAEAVARAQQIGDGLQYAFCQEWLAGLLRQRGDRERARAVAETLCAHARQQQNRAFEAAALRELSHLARLDGELDTADDLAHRALALTAEAGVLPEVTRHLLNVAGVAAAEESAEEAVRLFAAAQALSQELGCQPPLWDQVARDTDLERLRESLEPEAFEAAWTEGQALTVSEALAYAQRGRGERKRPSKGWASLSPTERQVVELLTQGLRNAEIAERLFVAPSTVKTHLGHVFAKLGVSTRAELAALAARRQ